MFGSSQELAKYKEKYEIERSDKMSLNLRLEALRADHDLEVRRLKSIHELELMKKQTEIDLFESLQTKKLRDEVVELKRLLAIAETKLEFMDRLTDVNADVLDVKQLVSNLIEKLPTVNINSIIAGLSAQVTKTEAE